MSDQGGWVRWGLAACAAGALSLAASPARPCGAFFPSSVENALTMDTQRVLTVWEGDYVSMHIEVVVEGDPEDWAWVLPIPENPELSLGDPAVFDALDSLTRPTVEVPSDSRGGGGGCGASDRALGGGAGGPFVERIDGGRIGAYVYDVLAATSASAMVTWLQDNGYAVPDGLAAALQPYASPTTRFLWARLDGSALGAGRNKPEPLVVRVRKPPDGRLAYPLALSRLNSADTLPVELYTLAPSRYRVENYASVELPEVAREIARQVRDGQEPDYAAAVDTLSAEAGGRLFVTEYARDLRERSVPPALAALVTDRSWFLTRLFARIAPDDLADAVVTFSKDGPEVAPYAVADPGDLAGGLVCLLLGLAVPLAASRRRREERE